MACVVITAGGDTDEFTDLCLIGRLGKMHGDVHARRIVRTRRSAAWPSRKLSVSRSTTRRAVGSLADGEGTCGLVWGVSVEIIKGSGIERADNGCASLTR